MTMTTNIESLIKSEIEKGKTYMVLKHGNLISGIFIDDNQASLYGLNKDIEKEKGEHSLYFGIAKGERVEAYKASKRLTKLFTNSFSDELGIEARDKDGYTALHLAAMSEDDIAVKILLELGADIEAKTRTGVTPLISAIGMGNAKTTKVLVEHGANLNAVSNGAMTMLMHAVHSKCTELVELVLSSKDFNKRDVGIGLVIAKHKKLPKILKLLKNYEASNMQLNKCNSLIMGNC